METVTVNELGRSWAAIEKRLATAGTLTVMRNGEVVATIAPPAKATTQKKGKRFSAEEHAKWMKKIWGDKKPSFTTEQLMAEERAERDFSRKLK